MKEVGMHILGAKRKRSNLLGRISTWHEIKCCFLLSPHRIIDEECNLTSSGLVR